MNKVQSYWGLIKKVTTGRGQGTAQACNDGDTTHKSASSFAEYYDKNDENIPIREKNAQRMVETFYDLVTDFYETGWGQSFHFAPRAPGETFRESIIRHEHFIANSIDLKRGEHCIDVGCGIGGPMRNIARFVGARITGITINEYQVRRGNQLNAEQGLAKFCKLEVRDFVSMGYADNTFDKAFACESTCHAPKRIDVFKETLRVLKPGGLFASMEWVLTDKYDDSNAKHREARHLVEEGNSLPLLISDKEAEQELEKAGFELVSSFDLAAQTEAMGQLPWWHTLQPGCSIEMFPSTTCGIYLTHAMSWTFEKIGVAPKGTLYTHELLCRARDGLLMAGKTGIFTPMHVIVGRKPLRS